MVGLGAGTSCSEWIDAAGDEALEQWAYGFASAIAAAVQIERGVDPLARTDTGRMHEWLDGYCRQHPTSPLSVALIRMVFASVP